MKSLEVKVRSVITLACADIRAKEKSIQNDRFVSRDRLVLGTDAD